MLTPGVSLKVLGGGGGVRDLLAYQGVTSIRVMRHVEMAARLKAAEAARAISDDPGGWYGYWDIPRFVLPKLILAKIGRLLPMKYAVWLKVLAYSYRRNSLYICSELVVSAYAHGVVTIHPV